MLRIPPGSPIRNRSRELPSLSRRSHTQRPSSPMLRSSSSNNYSLFSFGNVGGPEVAGGEPTIDFLPSVSFDDLQSSLESQWQSTDFMTQFPSPTGHGSILESRGMEDNKKMVERSNVTHSGGSTRVAIQPPPARSRTGSIVRRPSLSNRQTSISSTASFNSATSSNDAVKPPATLRPRRQSQYPPVSNSNLNKSTRKPIGTGAFDSPDFTSGPNMRRPDPVRSSVDGSSRVADASRNVSASRATKAKSVQPPSRIQTNTSADSSTLSAFSTDQSRASASFPRSPRNSKQQPLPTTPGSSKRTSVMPSGPHASHATGLGARTISPTDTRRMRRMSILPSSRDNSLILEPLPLPPTEVRPSSRSPSMLPRKASTPSSSRTTPDPNRKSFSSGLSVGSTTSYNTVRTSTGSLQPRIPPIGSSRLPAPKSLSNLPQSNPEEDEDVPPVPAIPKVYESPKDSPAEMNFFEKRKSNLTVDASSIHSTSTGSLSGVPVQEPAKTQPKTSMRRVAQNSTLDFDKKGPTAQQRKTEKSMNLPPLNLGPLSTPTVAKIAKLQHDQGQAERNFSSPPARKITKTPTTPMTASKGTFFARTRADKNASHFRSNSTVHQKRVDSPLVADTSSSTESLTDSIIKPAVSPFLSSSVPKEEGFEQMYLKRSKTGNGIRDTSDTGNTTTNSMVQPKPSGPRAQRTSKAPPKAPPLNTASKSPAPQSSSEEPPTPSSISSLRRKLSLSWKRSNSKSSNYQPEKSADGHAPRKDSMPPPRLPISATVGSFASTKAASPATTAKSNSSYLESRRRKTSGSSLNAILAHDKNRSDASLGSSGRATKVDTSVDGAAARSTMSNSSSVMQKIMRSKASTVTLRQLDVWTADLDKDDLVAEDEMKKLGNRRKETEIAAKTLDALRKRASAKERVSPQDAIRIAMLNIYERGEIIDYNDIYFCGTQNAAKVAGDLNSDVPNFGYDDERGDYTIVPGDHLSYRYEIIDILGKGSFGQVVRCIDHKTGVLVAVKIIRNKKRFHQQALVEVNILQKLRDWDPKNKHSMVNFTHSFYFRGHLCISTELLDMNLYEFIKSNAFRGFSLKLIRRFTKQMLSSLNLLKQHKVIHCDLKPENILLRHPLHSEIKVIDFGSSCFENEKVYTYIQSRFYRSPEVILGMTYGLPIDMWSVGCILAELFTGVPIFPGENEQEQLACIMEIFGPPEKHLIEKSTRKKLFFDSLGKPRLTVSSKGRRRRPSSKTLQQVLKCDDEPFLDFLSRCLRWDPDRRMKPDEAIRHEFITGQKTSVPVANARSANIREQSPIKRYNTVSTPRPLPEPPATSAGVKIGTSLRPRDASGITGSPVKPGTGSTFASRRVSGMAASSTASAHAKRTSSGTNGIGVGTSIPRVAGRVVSSKQDLAAAGANAAMSRRA